ncbi:uncharacterized protein J7T54_007632 [Emericellopsis cladophorae]|uniref:Chromo domain-containing protein n=1 Tax=Emericellopsis cladophorae TaxID=2686198 RepID=A0A9P9XVP2_9HYPO|nr:uncharacterized protein J7T54_007632 [Emericellopsis cladophorae]KAI6778691.1 hypothetical protein J7T54_007632 [Emericellopsis cladophorae]
MSARLLERFGWPSQSPVPKRPDNKLRETGSPSQQQSKKRAAPDPPLRTYGNKQARKALPLPKSSREAVVAAPAGRARSSQHKGSPTKSQPPSPLAYQPPIESSSRSESRAPLATVSTTGEYDEFAMASQLPFSGVSPHEQSQYVQVLDTGMTATQYGDIAEEISVEVNTRPQPESVEEEDLFVEAVPASRASSNGEDSAADVPPIIDDDQSKPPTPQPENETMAEDETTTLYQSQLPSRNPGDIYEVPSDNDGDPYFVFTRFLEHRWRGTTIELLVDWHGSEPTWEPEANLHHDALDALLKYWQQQGGHPENPNEEGLYDIYGIREHKGQKLLVEWTGYAPSEATWEPKKKIQKVAPQIVKEYFDSLKPAVPRQRRRKRQA